MASEEPSREPEPAPREPETKAEIVLRKHRICPYLGLRDDRTVVAMLPTGAHVCFASRRRYYPSIEHQIVRCMGPNYPGCSIYLDKKPDKTDNLYTLQGELTPPRRRWLRWAGLALVLILVAAAVVYAVASGLVPPLDWTFMPARPEATQLAVVAVATETPPPTVMPTPTPAVAIAQVTGPTRMARPPASAEVRTVTPAPQGEGQVLSLMPSRADVGWWASGESRPGLIGDSFLYAGVFEQQAYVSALRFGLRRVPRGAEIRSGIVRLTGLREDRLDRSANSSWMVQLIAESALPELPEASFFAVFEAPASFTLSPNVETADVGAGRVNEWVLDAAARGWLFQRLLDGATSVTVRIVPLANAGNALFAWDSGHGSESNGAPPELVLSLGPAPPTPPPTPTRPVIVATLTPEPENVMTVVAQTATATAELLVTRTNTPVPPEIVTPTPLPENLATVQAAALAAGLPPVVLDTPVLANAATAAADASYATAVALTTGTFTPVPTNYVTPALVYPSPPAENVATAAARSLTATAVAVSGAPTATRLWNAVDAIYVFATETPANRETAIAQIEEQNRIAVSTGTPTPTPWNLAVITRVPQPTATLIPLFIPTSDMTPTPTSTPTRVITNQDWERFRNKILFLSDRSGQEQTWVMDPSIGEVIGALTDARIHEEARTRFLANSPDGKQQAIVQPDGAGFFQIKIENFEYATIRQLTHFVRAIAYDPAWSPRGDQIAFVSTATQGDEIYVIAVDGDEPLRLTFNTWEWDKHPTWSPDGSQIAFYSNRETGRRQIWIMNADGSDQRNLSNNSYEDWDPVWIR